MESASAGGLCLKAAVTTTYYLVSQGRVLAEYSSMANPPEFTYIYAGDQRIACRDKTGKLFFYLNDHLGSARVVVDTTGIVKDKYRYQSYGADDGQTLSTNQPRRYTGQTWDGDGTFDLYYYGARYYDPTLGRFTQVDPARAHLSMSPYNYALGNPVLLIDPQGKQSVLPFFLTYDAPNDLRHFARVLDEIESSISGARASAARGLNEYVTRPFDRAAQFSAIGGVLIVATTFQPQCAAPAFVASGACGIVSLLGSVTEYLLEPSDDRFLAAAEKSARVAQESALRRVLGRTSTGELVIVVIDYLGQVIAVYPYDPSKDGPSGKENKGADQDKTTPMPSSAAYELSNGRVGRYERSDTERNYGPTAEQNRR